MGYQDAIRDSDLMDGLSIRFLKIFGMWNAVNKFRTRRERTISAKVHLIVTCFFGFTYVGFQILSLFNLEFDLQKLTYIFLHPLPAASLLCKILIYYFRMDTVSRLYNLIRHDFFNIPDNIKDEAKQIYNKISTMSNFCCNTAFISQGCLQILYLVFPGTPVDYILYHTGSITNVKTGKKKLLGGWYPVPMSESPYYEITYVYESIGLCWIATLLAFNFSVFFQLLMCLYAQFLVFKLRVSSLTVDPNEDISKIGDNLPNNKMTKIHQDLHEIFLEHEKLLKYTDDLRSVYNPMVTLILGIGIMALITGAVQILLGKTYDPSFLFQLSQVFAFVFMEIAMFCLGSSYIETESTDIQFAVYSSDWYKADLKFRRDAQMLMIRSRRSCTLTAVVMYPVNLETLGSICQFTYSAIALTMNNI